MSEWIKIEDGKPQYGEPVLIRTKGGVVQHITYNLDGADDTPDWFEPYHFDHDDELKFFPESGCSWMSIDNDLCA